LTFGFDISIHIRMVRMYMKTKNKIGVNMNRIGDKKTKLVLLIIFVVILTAPIKSVFADTRYVSDRLIIPVRDGKNKYDNVLGYIKTGTPVDVLEEKGRYSRIKTEDGLEGWVQSQYIISEKPKALIIEDLRNEINDLDKKNELLRNGQGFSSNKFMETKKIYEEKIRELTKEVNLNQKITAKAKRTLIQINKKYKNLLSNSKKTDELIRELEKLKKLNTELNTEINNFKKHSKNSLKSRGIKWVVAGAGVFLVGFIVGGLKRRKKRSIFY